MTEKNASGVYADAAPTLPRSHALTLARFHAVALTRHEMAAALSGGLIASCFLRFNLFPLAWVAFVPLLWALTQTVSRRQAIRIGLVAGLATNLPAFYWLVYTIHVFGGFGYPLALFFYVGLTFFSAGQFVLFALALQRVGRGPLALAAPVVWVALELLYPNLFPWRMGHCQWHAPVLMQIGDITGPYGLSFVMVWISAALTSAITQPQRRWQALGAATAATAAVVLYGALRLPTIERAIAAAPTVRVGLVQGDVGIKEKGDVRYFDINVGKYRQMSATIQDRVDVVVWPETVWQRWVPANAAQLVGKDNPFDDLRTYLIFGALSFRPRDGADPEEFNSAFLMAPDGVLLDRYDKHVLMPFGEYLPFASYFPAINKLVPEVGGFTAGSGVSIFRVPGKVSIGQLICYEDLLAGMSRRATQAGAEVLLNILNDAWYGNTAAPYQHQALALWRAIENRRYLLRGSNSGVTSIIDPVGRVVSEGGLFTAEAVTGTVHRMHIETFYTRYGDVFGWLIVAGAACLLVWRRRPDRSAVA